MPPGARSDPISSWAVLDAILRDERYVMTHALSPHMAEHARLLAELAPPQHS